MGRILPVGREGRESQEGLPGRRGKAISVGGLSMLVELGFLWKERQKLTQRNSKDSIALCSQK